MASEGVVKFRCQWVYKPPAPDWPPADLNRWRSKLFALGLVGVYPNHIGFGNVSQRIAGTNSFIVSGTQTGQYETLGAEHYTRVTAVELERNFVACEGPVQASSESLSHVALYLALPASQCVFHVHHPGLWTKLAHKLPTTADHAAYGTPELARELLRVGQGLANKISGLVVMGGHPEGLMAFGPTPDQAGSQLLRYLAE